MFVVFTGEPQSQKDPLNCLPFVPLENEYHLEHKNVKPHKSNKPIKSIVKCHSNNTEGGEGRARAGQARLELASARLKLARARSKLVRENLGPCNHLGWHFPSGEL